MLQRIVKSYAGLVPVAANATGPTVVTLTEPVEGWEPGTYRASRMGIFGSGPLGDYGDWLARLDRYSGESRALTAHGVQPCVLGPTACAEIRDALERIWPQEAEGGGEYAMLTDLWIEAAIRGANNGLVRVT